MAVLTYDLLSVRLVRLLLSFAYVQGMTPLHWAADRGHHDIIATLLAYSADVHAVDHDGQTPLHYACSCGHVTSAKLLIRAGANLEARDLEGQSAINLADEALRSELLLTVSDM
ncbi:hypothetical protein AHF37_04470 [Paragonimus kellicotti]|nr:hypothetical protein AHF37_04470 [Paragonimus kellicotti]